MVMEHANAHVKRVLATFLRLYFRNPEHYRRKLPRQIPDERFAETAIYVSEPEELRSWPAMIITGSSGAMVTAGLADFCHEIRDFRTGAIAALRYQGFYELAVNVDLGCRSPLEREVLTDLTAKALRFDLRRFIQNNGVLIKNVTYGGETTAEYTTNKVYAAQLKVDTWSTWVEDRSLLDPDEFNVRVTMADNWTDGVVTVSGNRDDYAHPGEVDKATGKPVNRVLGDFGEN